MKCEDGDEVKAALMAAKAARDRLKSFALSLQKSETEEHVMKSLRSVVFWALAFVEDVKVDNRKEEPFARAVFKEVVEFCRAGMQTTAFCRFFINFGRLLEPSQLSSVFPLPESTDRRPSIDFSESKRRPDFQRRRGGETVEDLANLCARFGDCVGACNALSLYGDEVNAHGKALILIQHVIEKVGEEGLAWLTETGNDDFEEYAYPPPWAASECDLSLLGPLIAFARRIENCCSPAARREGRRRYSSSDLGHVKGRIGENGVEGRVFGSGTGSSSGKKTRRRRHSSVEIHSPGEASNGDRPLKENGHVALSPTHSPRVSQVQGNGHQLLDANTPLNSRSSTRTKSSEKSSSSAEAPPAPTSPFGRLEGYFNLLSHLGITSGGKGATNGIVANDNSSASVAGNASAPSTPLQSELSPSPLKVPSGLRNVVLPNTVSSSVWPVLKSWLDEGGLEAKKAEFVKKIIYDFCVLEDVGLEGSLKSFVGL